MLLGQLLRCDASHISGQAEHMIGQETLYGSSYGNFSKMFEIFQTPVVIFLSCRVQKKIAWDKFL